MAPVSERGGVLTLDDCRCPICLEILLEPVTLPCTHTFCKGCFLESVDKAALCCPLCRRRVSTWARLNSRSNTLVDQQLWTRIQASFPRQCQRRLSGQDAAEADLGASVCPRVSQPGELRQEYEDQVTKLTAEQEEERRVSEEFIQRLLAEEEQQLQEEQRRRDEDERLARLLSDQLNSAAVPPESPPPAGGPPSTKKKKKKVETAAGQMERFLCRPVKSSSSDCSFTANKENILLGEQQADGVPPAPSPASGGGAETLRNPQPSSAKRKSSEQETPEDEEEEGSKRVCAGSASSLGEWVGAEREAELLRRRRQEEEDRRLAELLQTQLDQEERQRAPDRRKGSSDAYLLRHGPDTPSRPPRKTAKTSSPPPAASARTANRCSTSSTPSSTKQTTLTEMFSSLNS